MDLTESLPDLEYEKRVAFEEDIERKSVLDEISANSKAG
jgi:hypothetical protein